MPYRKVKQNTVHNRSPTLVSRFRNIGCYSRLVQYAAGVIAPRQFGSIVQGLLRGRMQIHLVCHAVSLHGSDP